MKRTLLIGAALLLLLLLALSPSKPAIFAAQTIQKAQPTPTPAPEVEGQHSAMPEAAEKGAGETDSEMISQTTTVDLLARVEGLEATVAELYTAHQMAHAASFDQANAVNTAIYLLDSAGLHELETRLVNDREILPGDGGHVAQISRVLSTVPWPDALAEDAAKLQGMLAGLATSLSDDDLDTVRPLSTETHTAYHVFSHNAQMWLAETTTTAMADADGRNNRVNTAIYLLDDVGLHELAERLSEEREIQPGDSGPVAQLARLFTTLDWPEELAADASTLHTTLSDLALALADDDLKTSTALAQQAHEEQHDFSQNAQAWLAAQSVDGGHDGEHSGEAHPGEQPAEHPHGG